MTLYIGSRLKIKGQPLVELGLVHGLALPPRKGPRHWPGLRTWCTTPLEMPRAAAIRSWESLPTYLRRSIHPCCQAIEAVYTD